MAKPRPHKEHMILLYRKVESRLYGHIRFYRHNGSDKSPPIMLKESRPFVIGEYVEDLNRMKVFGSVEFLLEEIRRLVNEFIAYNHKWRTSRKQASNEQTDFTYHQHVMDFVILTSTHTRNLIQMINRLNGKSVAKRNYEGQPDGQLKLRELFDILIHNRYHYFDGALIRDIYSDKTRKNSPLSNRFMGYAIDSNEYINAICDVIFDVSVRDLTQLLRSKFKTINSSSSPHDIVFLIQNLHSFSDLMQTKIPTAGYDLMMNLMFKDVELKEILSQNGKQVRLAFQPPNIAIREELEKREFNVTVRFADAARGVTVAKENLKNHSVYVHHESFFDQINSVFGADKLLEGPKITVVAGDYDTQSTEMEK